MDISYFIDISIFFIDKFLKVIFIINFRIAK